MAKKKKVEELPDGCVRAIATKDGYAPTSPGSSPRKIEKGQTIIIEKVKVEGGKAKNPNTGEMVDIKPASWLETVESLEEPDVPADAGDGGGKDEE